MSEKVEILRVILGSHAHGLATPESDHDYGSVFITPTSELLKIGGIVKTVEQKENDNDDNTVWELGHFLQLAIKSNPSILEVFNAPIVCKHFPNGMWHEGELSQTGQKLRALFPSIWSSKGVYNAFLGYSHNQHKRMFDDKEEFSKRRGKYAVAHLRVLLQGIELLTTETLSVRVKDYYLDDGFHLHLPPWAVEWLENEKGYLEKQAESWVAYLREIKTQNPPIGNIIDTAAYLKDELRKAYEANPNHETNLDEVNKFLLQTRKENW